MAQSQCLLHVWSEAGAVGAAILLIFGLLVMRSIRRTLVPAQGALFATFSACAMIAALDTALLRHGSAPPLR
jgi:hypothetical protein